MLLLLLLLRLPCLGLGMIDAVGLMLGLVDK